MLLAEDVYNLLLDEFRVDKRGQALLVDEFNRAARLVNQEMYSDYCREFEEDIENIDALAYFKTYSYGIPLTDGIGSLPDDYYRIIGKPGIIDDDGVVRKVDLVTEFEYRSRSEDYLTQPTTTHPICRIGGISATYAKQIRVSPITITTIYLDYLRELTIPFLDYYINDTTFNITFLDETTDLQTVPVGSTYRDGTPGAGTATTTSLTNNFDWGEDNLKLLLTKLVNRVAKQLPDELLLQTSTAEQAKEDAT